MWEPHGNASSTEYEVTLFGSSGKALIADNGTVNTYTRQNDW